MSILNPQVRPLPEHPADTEERHAKALAEIQKMREDFAQMRADNLMLKRDRDQLANKVELLEADKDHWRNTALVIQRKLIRMASKMETFVKLGEEAVEIMKDARDYEAALDHQETNRREADVDKAGSEVVELLRGAVKQQQEQA